MIAPRSSARADVASRRGFMHLPEGFKVIASRQEVPEATAPAANAELVETISTEGSICSVVGEASHRSVRVGLLAIAGAKPRLDMLNSTAVLKRGEKFKRLPPQLSVRTRLSGDIEDEIDEPGDGSERRQDAILSEKIAERRRSEQDDEEHRPAMNCVEEALAVLVIERVSNQFELKPASWRQSRSSLGGLGPIGWFRGCGSAGGCGLGGCGALLIDHCWSPISWLLKVKGCEGLRKPTRSQRVGTFYLAELPIARGCT